MKKLVKRLAWTLGYRPAHGNYGVERQEHLGGYWRGGDPHSWCPEIWDAVMNEYAIRSVVDVGCGEGYSTKYFRDHGLRVLGIEGGAEAIRHSVVPEAIVRTITRRGRTCRRTRTIWPGAASSWSTSKSGSSTTFWRRLRRRSTA